ncbi:MAG TPA: hypothetical protein VF978_03135 [Gemmatimonadales bacterium]
MIDTVTVQMLLPEIEAPLRLRVFPSPAAETVPPAQSVKAAGVAALKTFAG